MGQRDDIEPVAFTTVEVEDYVLLDLSGSVKWTERIKVFGRVENLLDEDYEDVLGFSTAGRSAYAGLQVDF